MEALPKVFKNLFFYMIHMITHLLSLVLINFCSTNHSVLNKEINATLQELVVMSCLLIKKKKKK